MPRPSVWEISAVFASFALLCAFTASGLLGGAPFLAALIELVLFLPSAFFGRRVFLRGFSVFRARRLNEEFFVVLAVIFGLSFSLYEIFMIVFTERGAERLLFAPCSAAILLSLLGDYASSKTKPKESALALLESMKLCEATVLRDGAEERLPASEVKEGDILTIRPDSAVPCDAEIIAGRSDLDEKAVTGELAPAFKSEGDYVFAGSRNISGFLTVRALGGESRLDRLIYSYKTAQKPLQNGFTRRFTRACGLIGCALAIIIAAAVSFLAGADSGAFFAIATLILLCPCGFSLARARVDLSAASKAETEGILLKDPSALSRLEKVGCAVIDRTGTATVGKLSVCDVVSLSDLDEDSVIRLAAALCAEFYEPPFEAVTEQCRLKGIAVPPCIAPERLAGKLTGIVDGGRVELSSLYEDVSPFAGEYPRLGEGKKTVFALFRADEALGLIAVSDRIKPNASAAVKMLSERGIPSYLATGGMGEALESEASELGAKGCEAELSGEDIMKYVCGLRGSGAVIMIGDGVGDCAALKAADFSFALASGAEAAKKSASAVLLRNDLRDVMHALSLSASAEKFEKLSLSALAVLRAAALLTAALLCVFSGCSIGIVAGSAVEVVSAVLPWILSLGVTARKEK